MHQQKNDCVVSAAAAVSRKKKCQFVIQRNEKMKTKNHLSESDLHISMYLYGNNSAEEAAARGPSVGGIAADCQQQ